VFPGIIIPIRIQAGAFVCCVAWLLTVLFVLPRRCSRVFPVSTWMQTGISKGWFLLFIFSVA